MVVVCKWWMYGAVFFVFFFFKQKTAYEMRISDWSSDVCSSDLGFKTVNDTHGHAVGDDVLKTFASAASASIRKSDSLCRVGGDEFIILMTTASPARGYSAAEHLHARLSRIMETLPFEVTRSEEHTSELQSLMRTSYAVFCLKKKKHK